MITLSDCMRRTTRAGLVALFALVGLVAWDTATVASASEASKPSDLAGAAAASLSAEESTPGPTGAEVGSSSKKKLKLADLRKGAPATPFWQRLLSVFGLLVFVGLAVLLSRNRGAIRWRTVAWGIGLQVAFGLVVLSPTVGDFFFTVVNSSVSKLLSFSEAGASFVFQSVDPHEVTSVDMQTGKQTTETYIGRISPPLKTFAFWILPTVIFFSGLMSILYHMGIMQLLVRIAAKVMQKTMGTSGSESLSAAANIFVGMTEAPLVVKPFIDKMTASELHAIMVGGFATVAGGVLAAYVGFLKDSIPDIAGHLVVASVMSAPAALAIAKVIFPETEDSATQAGAEMVVAKQDINVVEALARGSSEGLGLAVNIAAMLLTFVAMIALINALLGGVSSLLVTLGLDIALSLEGILGWLFAPLAWCMGVPWSEAPTVGALLGQKMVLTELVAYSHLGEILKGDNPLSYRSAVISSYALCGFANFASIGIQIGGIGGIAPKRRAELAQFGLLAMLGGTLAAMMTATIAGIIL